MQKRHIGLHDHVAQLYVVNLDEMLLTLSYENRVDALTQSLNMLNDFTWSRNSMHTQYN